MHTIFLKITTILLVVVLLTSPAAAAELEIVTSTDSVIQGEKIFVTVVHDGMPVENVFLHFTIDRGTPIYAKTNATGQAVFKPDITGTLKIVAMKDDKISAYKYITITQASDGDDGDGGDGGDDGDDDPSDWWRVTLPSGTFNKTTRDTNKEYTINWQTALGALQKASEVGGFDYTLEETTWGPMVYAIADKEKYDEGETSGWMYQVNGESPMVGAHDYSVGVDDKIIWYFSKSMDTTPDTSSRVLKITIKGSDGDSGSGDSSSTPTPTPAPNQLVEEVKEIELIEAGANASVTFDKMDVTQITLNANSTIRNASIMIQPLGKTAFIVNVSGIPYCYFNITTTNLTNADIAQATVEFKVNKSWLNASNIDEATITLSRYRDNHWNALPTVKIGEDNTSLYFKAVTPGFSSFAISGERPVPPLISAPSATTLPAPAATTKDTSSSALTLTPASTPSALIPRLKEIVISTVGIAVLLIALVAYFTRRRERE
jgi:PGF-pre-PGF domain-containing protein